MAVLASTQAPFPTSTFQSPLSSDATPADLLQFLRTLLVEESITDKEGWSALVSGLSQHFLESFPSRQFGSWAVLHEKVQLADISLDIIARATPHIQGILLEDEGRVLIILVRFLKFLAAMESWTEGSNSTSSDIPDPEQLCSKALQTTVSVLESLQIKLSLRDCKSFSPNAVIPSVLQKCLSTIRVATGPALPLKIGLFNNTWAVKELPNDPFLLEADSSGPSSHLELDSHRTLWAILSHLLLVSVKVLVSSCHIPQWFNGALFPHTAMAMRAYTGALLSQSCTIPRRCRAKAFLSLINVFQTMYPLAGDCRVGLRTVPTLLLLSRLREGPDVEWEAADAALQVVLDTATLEPDTAVSSVIEVLNVEQWGESADTLRACACAAAVRTLQQLRPDTMRRLCPALFREDRAGCLSRIHHIITESMPAPLLDRKEKCGWRSKFNSLRGHAFFKEMDWPDDTMDDSRWRNKVLCGIRDKITSTLIDVDPETRILLINSLKDSAYESSDPKWSTGPDSLDTDLSLIHVCLPIIERLTADLEGQVHLIVWKHAYDAVTCLLKYSDQIQEAEEGILNTLEGFIKPGLHSDDRAIRLASGRCLVAFVHISRQLDQSAARRFEKAFALLDEMLRKDRDTVKETTLITVGLIGRSSDAAVLGRVLQCLITQLDQSNTLLKGLTYIQLLALTKHHKRPPYLLLAPYLPKISTYVVSNICQQPNLLVETCRFISLSPNDFLSLTIPHTLPHLFGTCNLEALEKLGQELKQKVSSMFLNASAEILSHTFMMQGPGQTSQALNFILRILTVAANKAEIALGNVVRSCIVPLLANLVIAMGNENTERAESAKQATARVESSITSDVIGRGTGRNSMGGFLKTYVLGILVHLNEVLQDVQGRKSIETKQEVLRGLGSLIEQIGSSIANVAPQIMAILQSTLGDPGLAEVTLRTWENFITTLNMHDIGSHVGSTSAAFVTSWPHLSLQAQGVVRRILDYVILENASAIETHLHEIVDLSGIPAFEPYCKHLLTLRPHISVQENLLAILDRSTSDNAMVVSQSLQELRHFMQETNNDFVRDLTSGDAFDPLVGQIVQVLVSAACREGEHAEPLRHLAFDCFGVLGAADPDRFEMPYQDTRMVVLNNFTDEQESISFALHLIQDILVRAFRSTNDLKFQSHLAYAIQELLKFCQFTPELVIQGSTGSIPLKVRTRWASLPKYVLETATPLLGAKYSLGESSTSDVGHPIYPTQSTYREWIQVWTSHLITKVCGDRARTVFEVFRAAVRNKDVGVAHHLLPHLVLNILVSGEDDDVQHVRTEIITVLEDRINSTSTFSPDKRLLCAQAVFMLMDHLNKWLRIVRQDLSTKKHESRRARHSSAINDAEEQMSRVDSILGSIDQDLVAKAAFECKAYARSLMNFEKQIVMLQKRNVPLEELQVYYDKLHEIYSHLDEPDGMEGVSTLILAPSLEHQIRQHESNGKWTSAQSCWEVRLQRSPDNVEYHCGLLRCLRNLGHYDTLRTHIRGVLTRNPGWEAALAGFQVEGAWMVRDWSVVRKIVADNDVHTPELVIARLLLAMHSSDEAGLTQTLTWARGHLGAPITAAGESGYRRAYDAILNLHLVHDLERIFNSVNDAQQTQKLNLPMALSPILQSRLNATLPTFRTREPILSMHRVAFSIATGGSSYFERAIGNAWLSTAKIARKAGHWQTSYSAVLQAQESRGSFSRLQSSKLTKAIGEPLRALSELDHMLKGIENGPRGAASTVIDLTDGDQRDELKSLADKARLLRARWMRESERYDATTVLKEFSALAKALSESENAHFHHGHFQDECYKNLSSSDKKNRGPRMNLHTVKAYSTAIRLGSKYTYQMIPRLLTLWLDMGEDQVLSQSDAFHAINDELKKAVAHTPVYKWLTAFPQIVSRVDHRNSEAYAVLSRLIVTVLQEYPQQGLWLFMSVVKSTKLMREQRGKDILGQLRNHPRLVSTKVPQLVNECLAMSAELLRLCDHPIKDDNARALKMNRDFPILAKLAPSHLIIPLQESLTVNLPTSSAENNHQPFPQDAPTFIKFADEIEIMKSLAKPRKITIMGSNGQTYMFLGKPKDDLRKDARLMDFNSIINKLLKTNSESRRRQLRIRTYSVVTLNEECGFIQWVPNTMPIRPILLKYYSARGIDTWNRDMNATFNKIKEASDRDASKLFGQKILTLFPPIFHEWFIETFPEPSAWLASRLAYGRTAAVMSMVGFILGLGDRHLENVLLDMNTGDVVHVDFNCLFEKGKTLETPERVPFRLTSNMVDGLGVTGVEGVFRISSEITMQLLRDNKDILMSVLDAFIHDPLVEWEDEKRKKERQTKGDRNAVKQSVDLRQLARDALNPIEKKLKGLYTKDSNRNEKKNKEVTTSNLVQMLIEEATDLRNLAKMYPGWAPWH